MRKRQWLPLIVLLALAASLFLPASAFAQGVQWRVLTLNSIGCTPGATQFTTEFSGFSGAPGPERFRTVVEAGGLTYMDEDAGVPGTDGLYGWSLYPSSSGGPTNGTWPLPPDTLIFVHFMLIDGVGGPTITEQVVVLTQCNGGTIFADFGVPGADMVAIPSTAVVGSFVATTPIYFAPQADAATTTVMEAGKTVWVYGVDASGGYYKVMLSGKFFWVPVNTMGPNYDAVWQGRPLPTGTVN